MAATLQLHRFGIDAYLFDQNPKDSLLKNAWYVENYLGHYPGEKGVKLLQKFQLHLTQNKIKTIKSKVSLLSYLAKTQSFKIKTNKKGYFADYVVVASGTKPKLLITDPPLASSRLFYNVFPLLKKRHKTILIVGAGDAAFDNALNLAKYNKIIICNRLNYTNALPLLVNKVMKHRNITYLKNHELCSFIPIASRKKSVFVLVNKLKNISINIKADYLLIAIGRLPQKDFYDEKLHIIEKRLIKKGKLLLAGDVKNDCNRQVAIAVGDGIKAAMQIYHS